MKRLIFQVQLGEAKNSKLYGHCIDSVHEYAKRIGADHRIQRAPKLFIKPDPFNTNRSPESYGKHGGFLPIYEKENAFDLLGKYDQIAIIDADIYVRPDAPNIFEDIDPEVAIGAVVEKKMPINGAYMHKIKNYSHMQYSTLASKVEWEYDTPTGFEFMNMGMMVLNKSFKDYLDGDDAKKFLQRNEFKDFIDGKGPWKWSTDQTLLNYWIRKRKVPVQHMDWRWNGLYSALRTDKIKDAHFVHFFLKDKLPNRGEDVEALMKTI